MKDGINGIHGFTNADRTSEKRRVLRERELRPACAKSNIDDKILYKYVHKIKTAVQYSMVT